MAVRRNYRINLRNYGNPPAIMVSQYDENYDLVFEVYDGVVPATGLNAYTVKLVGRQPGNDPALKYEFTGTVSGIANNILSFTIDTTMTGRAGKGTAEIVIIDTTNDVKFASFNLPVYVEKAAVPDDAIDADVERAQEIADEVQDIVDTAAAEVKGEAEAWAVGERDGEPVPSTDPTYHNNAKYYAEQAQDIADSIGIDATLSISGKAADAKKTGDEISSLKEDLSLSGIEQIPYVKTGTGNIADNGLISYSSPGSGYNYMMLIDDADTIARIKHIKAYLGNNGYKYGIAFANANGSPISGTYGAFPSATASAQTIDVDVPSGAAKIYLYNRYSVLENPTIAIVTNDGYEARISIAEADIDALQERNSNANMLMTAFVKKGRWYNAGEGTGNYDYYIVPVESGTSYTISKGVRFLSKQSTSISGYNPVTTDDISYTADYTGDLYITFSNTIDGVYCCETAEYQEGAGWFNKKYLAQSSGRSKCAVMSQKAVTDLVASTDALNGKKWVACGDSFTHGDFTGLSTTDYTFQDEPYKNCNKVYPFFIGRRTGATIVNEAVNGSTMAYIDGSRSEFSTPNGRYTQIPSDADYITLYFGINDSHQNVPIGNIDDTENTTFYGAWNIVMEYLITHYPTAKIGIIISNGCDSIDYPNAEIAIAKKWGVSYFDMNGDYTIPLVYRVNGKPNLCQDVIDVRTLQYRVSSSNGHPNVACHEDESTFIESWIKSL